MSKVTTDYYCHTGKKYKHLTAANGAYGDHVHFEVYEDKCDLCEQTKTIMAIDTSNGEYATLYICKECFNKEIEDDWSPIEPTKNTGPGEK